MLALNYGEARSEVVVTLESGQNGRIMETILLVFHCRKKKVHQMENTP